MNSRARSTLRSVSVAISAPWTLRPHRRRRLGDARHRVRREQAQRLLHRALELWIAPCCRVARRDLDLDVRRHADVLDVPLPLEVDEATARVGDRPAVDQHLRVPDPDETAPRLRPDQRTDLRLLE